MDGRRFADLLTAGGRIYHETHYAPLLAMQGAVRAIALELCRADRRRLPVLVNSALKRGDDGQPLLIRTTIFDATDRQRYERELLLGRDREREARERVERLHEHEAEVAHVLQRSMLESPAVRDPRVRVGTRYRPAIDTLEVGGDWHDAFPLGEDRIGVVVGDVVGRGIQAATAMGQLRSATRALAGAGLGGPAEVLVALDRFASGMPMALMATLVYVEIELEDGGARFVSAGHPPPLLLEPGAEPVALPGGRWLPLGVAKRGERPVEGRLALAPGAQLLLYTDGLVERRGESVDEGVRRLAHTVSDLGGRDPQALVDELVEHLVAGEERRDDVCALCVELRADRGERGPLVDGDLPGV